MSVAQTEKPACSGGSARLYTDDPEGTRGAGVAMTEGEAQADGRPTAGAVLAGEIADSKARRGRSRDLKPLMRLAPYMRAHLGDLFLAAFFMLFAAAATLGLTVAARLVIDRGINSGSMAEVNRWFLVLAAVAVASAISTALRYFYVTKVGERIVADLRRGLYAHILSLDPGFFLKMRLGEVLSRLTTDISIVETLLGTSLSVALRNLLTLEGADRKSTRPELQSH